MLGRRARAARVYHRGAPERAGRPQPGCFGDDAAHDGGMITAQRHGQPTNLVGLCLKTDACNAGNGGSLVDCQNQQNR